MSEGEGFSLSQPPSTAPSKSEFTYRTHLVIYNFLRFVPSSLTSSPTDEIIDPALVESPVMIAPPLSQDAISSQHVGGNERGGGDAHTSENPEDGGNRGQNNCQDMFSELRTRVNERNRRREADAAESKQRAVQIRKMLREFMEKVSERDQRLTDAGAVPPTTAIIRKNNATKFLMDPASPSAAVERTIVASSVIPSFGCIQVSDSPFGNPQCSSTPLNVGQTDVTADQLSSSESNTNSAYIDICDMADDVESLVNAGVVPPVSKSLKDELSLCWENLERNRSGEFS